MGAGSVGRDEAVKHQGAAETREPSRPRRGQLDWARLFQGHYCNFTSKSWYSRQVLELQFLWDGGSSKYLALVRIFYSLLD